MGSDRSAPPLRIRDRAEFRSKPRPYTACRDTPVSEAVERMSALDIGSVIVCDGTGRVEGVVTERDIMKRLVNRGLDAAATRLGDIMTSNPRVAREDDDLLDWLRIMSDERFRRLPIVDADGRIKAVMTQGDFVSYTWPDLIHQGRQIVRTTVSRNAHLFLIGGGVMAYSLVMILLLRAI